VTPKLVAWARANLVPEADLFVTSSVNEGRAAAADVVRGGYDALCVGGGDGTFMQAARDLLGLGPERVRLLFPLRLGGGNAIHDVCGSSQPTRAGLAADVARAGSDEASSRLGLLEVNGILTHFTGVGIDAKHVEDFDSLIKQKLRPGLLGPLFHGIPAILLTVLARTLPRLIREPRSTLRIINEGSPVHRLDAAGEPTGEAVPSGGQLYEGPITIAAAATISVYSRSITFFPFADKLLNRFHLRVSSAGAGEAMANLPAILRGTYFNPATVWDFGASRVRFELSEAPIRGEAHSSRASHWRRRRSISASDSPGNLARSAIRRSRIPIRIASIACRARSAGGVRRARSMSSFRRGSTIES